MLCSMCDGKLKVTVTGGEFFVRESSTPDSVQFDPPTDIEGNPKGLDEMLAVKIECSRDSSHFLFGSSEAAIKREAFLRILQAAREYVVKYNQPSR